MAQCDQTTDLQSQPGWEASGRALLGDCILLSSPRRRPQKGKSMTEDQIKYMVDRFLMWKLPEHFNPDNGISFTPTFNHHAPSGPQKREPVGTNLFDAQQATAMVRHMIEGLPGHSAGGR